MYSLAGVVSIGVRLYLYTDNLRPPTVHRPCGDPVHGDAAEHQAPALTCFQFRSRGELRCVMSPRGRTRQSSL